MATDQICTSRAKQTTSRNGTSWQCSPAVHYPSTNEYHVAVTADQGRYPAYDTADRVGYLEFDFDLDLSCTDISKIELSSYVTGGLGDWAEKTIGFYKWEGHIHPSKYTENNLLGTLTSKDLHDGNARKTFTFDSETNSDLFYALKEYFEAGNNVLIICRPNDTTTYLETYGFTDNYLRLALTDIEITYQHTTRVGFHFYVNGQSKASISSSIGKCSIEIDGTIYDNVRYSNDSYRAPGGTPYKITVVPESGWRASGGVTGTFPEYKEGVVSGIRWPIKFYQEYQVTYNNGYNEDTESDVKVYGTDLPVQPAITRSNSSAGKYTVTLHPQNGSDNFELDAEITASYRFKWWKDSQGSTYKVNEIANLNYTRNEPTTMTAEWETTTETSPVELPQITKPGYSFMGWSTSPEAVTGITGSYTPDRDDITLYAVWAPEGLIMIDDGTQFNPHTIWIDNGTSWDQYMAYIDTGTDWILCNE